MWKPDAIIADIVLDHPESARVLQKHGIDFCCRGDRSLSEACTERGVDATLVLDELKKAVSDGGAALDLRALSTAELIQYIVERHHGYLREALPFAGGLAKKVAGVHGARNERLLELQRIVEELRDTLEPHLEQEETQLFPALLAARESNSELRPALDSMVSEHREVGALLERMRTTADGYRLPDWACRSYRALFAELERLEEDVLRHVHAENHVLRPRYA